MSMTMKLHDIMTPNVQVVPPECLVNEAARRMKDFDVGALPIYDGEKLLGMITDRDITLKATAEGLDPSIVEVRDIMSTPIITCFEDQDLEEAARIMEMRQIRRLAVLDRGNRLVGMISLGDFAVKSDDEPLVAEVLERISEPIPPRAA